MPVGGSRHYDGGGLGMEGIWKCPSCGADNDGPLASGCTRCGAGKPGRHIGREAPAPPPPPPPEPPAEDEPEVEEHLGVFDRWALSHPKATLEEAFTAGYIEGTRDTARRLAPRPPLATDRDAKVIRTIVAALDYFADQVLRRAPAEVDTGEWCSVDEVRSLITQLTTTGEVVHA
jgi:hypothetical protein